MTEYRTLTLSGHRELFELNAYSSIALGTSSLGFLFFRTEPSYSFYYSSLGYSVNGNNPLIDYPDNRGSVQTVSKGTINGSSDTTTQGILGAYGTSASSTDANSSTTFTTSASALLTTLFGTDNTVTNVSNPTSDSFILGKTYVGTADYLFQYIENSGYYYYNSEKNAASYNASDNRFYVYDYLVYSSATGSTDDFFPFNYTLSSTDTSVAIAQTSINYWFGMSTEIEFYLPYAVSTGDNKGIDDYHMTFKFSGDDDVWVFVDDQLVLDLGGVHGQAYGEIDFTTGEVVIVNTAEATVNGETVKYVDYNARGIIDYTEAAETAGLVEKQEDATAIIKGLSAGSHTLTFYYLERGASQSNAAIYFNISSTTYNLNLSKVDEEDGTTELDGAEFTFYTDSTFTTEAELLKAQNGTTAYSTFASTETVYGLLEGVTYYVVETTAPDGYSAEGKYFTVLLSGSVLTITVYETGSTEAVELYTYTITCDSNGTCTYTLTYAGGATTKPASDSWYYVLGDNATFSASVSSSGSVEYYTIGLTIANAAGYELPATGGTGTGRYMTTGEILVLVAAAGLMITAFYQLVWSRKFRTEGNKGEKNEDKARSGKHCAKARERPREHRANHGQARDRPVE